MQRQHRIVSVLQTQVRAHGRLFCAFQIAQQRIDHDVADHANRLRRNAFGQQILISVTRRREQEIRDLIGEHAIDFFRHSSIAAAQTGFDVRDFDVELGADQCTSHR